MIDKERALVTLKIARDKILFALLVHSYSKTGYLKQITDTPGEEITSFTKFLPGIFRYTEK